MTRQPLQLLYAEGSHHCGRRGRGHWCGMQTDDDQGPWKGTHLDHGDEEQPVSMAQVP